MESSSNCNLNCFRCPCDEKKLVFSFSLPNCCGRCGRNLTPENLEVLSPVPKPFVDASQVSSCLLLKPTKGDFLNSYFDGCDLHISVVNSKGLLFEFNSCGLRKVNSQQFLDQLQCWNHSLPIPIDPDKLAKPGQWDECLESTSQMDCWTSSSYDENSWNCYTFVLKFLESLTGRPINKEAFTQRYILPKLERAKLYIDWYRKVTENGTHEIETDVESVE